MKSLQLGLSIIFEQETFHMTDWVLFLGIKSHFGNAMIHWAIAKVRNRLEIRH